MLMFATATGTTQPDYIALAMLLVLLVVVAVMALRKRFGAAKKTQPDVAAPTVTVEDSAKPAAPGSAGQLKLHDVEPKNAAMLMAIVADKVGKPLNELRFLSIKEVK